MFSIAILDDDKTCLNEIISMTKRWLEASREKWTIRSYTNEEELFLDAANGGFSLYLLDVVLSGTNGIAFAKRLRAADPNAVVIFISSSVEYAADSYDVNAFYYLLKPLSEEKLFSVLNNAAALVKGRTRSLFVKTADGTERLLFDEICYADLYTRRARFFNFPTTLSKRPIHIPVFFLIFAVMILTYVTMFRMIYQTITIYEARERENLLTIETSSLMSRLKEFEEKNEAVAIYRHDERHRLQQLSAMLMEGRDRNSAFLQRPHHKRRAVLLRGGGRTRRHSVLFQRRRTEAGIGRSGNVPHCDRERA